MLRSHTCRLELATQYKHQPSAAPTRLPSVGGSAAKPRIKAEPIETSVIGQLLSFGFAIEARYYSKLQIR